MGSSPSRLFGRDTCAPRAELLHGSTASVLKHYPNGFGAYNWPILQYHNWLEHHLNEFGTYNWPIFGKGNLGLCNGCGEGCTHLEVGEKNCPN